MEEFRVVNLFSGMVTIVVASNVLDAIKQGQKHFTEPNRPNAIVRILN